MIRNCAESWRSEEPSWASSGLRWALSVYWKTSQWSELGGYLPLIQVFEYLGVLHSASGTGDVVEVVVL